MPSYKAPTRDARFIINEVLKLESYSNLPGFDGITTLSEDVKEPKRTVPLATVLVCLFTGIFGGLQVYLAHQVWPDYTSYPNVDTAFFDVCDRVGGKFLFNAMAVVLVTSELSELLGLADRIIMLVGGRVGGSFTREQATEERLLAAALSQPVATSAADTQERP